MPGSSFVPGQYRPFDCGGKVGQIFHADCKRPGQCEGERGPCPWHSHGEVPWWPPNLRTMYTTPRPAGLGRISGSKSAPTRGRDATSRTCTAPAHVAVPGPPRQVRPGAGVERFCTDSPAGATVELGKATSPSASGPQWRVTPRAGLILPLAGSRHRATGLAPRPMLPPAQGQVVLTSPGARAALDFRHRSARLWAARGWLAQFLV